MAESETRREDGDLLASLDLSKVKFPSDRISIGDLRRAFPAEFDIGFGPGAGLQPKFFFGAVDPAEEIGNILYLERLIAAHVFASVVGCESPADSGFPYKEMKKDLAKLYVQHGIAAKHESSELIRQFEEHAAKLGNDVRPRSR